MKQTTKEKLEAAVAACADKAANASPNALSALQYTQAAVNAANALSVLVHMEQPQKG